MASPPHNSDSPLSAQTVAFSLLTYIELSVGVWQNLAESLEAIAAQVQTDPAACQDALKHLALRARDASSATQEMVTTGQQQLMGGEAQRPLQ